MTNGSPGPGKRVRVTPHEYLGTAVYHSLYLPERWRKSQRIPVIVEYTGNYYPAAGSTGEVKNACLGYGLSAGKFIWVVMPYIASGGQKNELTWWGDETATVAYCKRNLTRIILEYGGDPSHIYICGFSRGAIGVNYIGLHDDEIASFWAGFISHDHYDGERQWGGTSWGSPLSAYRAKARERLLRLNGRPALVMQEGSTTNIRKYLETMTQLDGFTFMDIPIKQLFPNIPNQDLIHSHTDKWLLYENQSSIRAREWLFKRAGKVE